MDELRLSFIIGGAIAIIGVLCHGLWSVRKRNQAQKEQLNTEKQFDNYYDEDLAISADDPLLHDDDVELVMLSSEEYEESAKEPSFFAENDEPLNDADEPQVTVTSDVIRDKAGEARSDVELDEKEEIGSTLSNVSPMDMPRRFESQSAHIDATGTIPEPPESLLRSSIEEPEQSVAVPPKAVKSNQNEKVVAPSSQPMDKMIQKNKARSSSSKGRVEPSLGQDQIRIDFEPDTPVDSEIDKSAERSQSQASELPEQEVLVLNVRMDEGEGISGASLLPMLLTLGFKFGDQDIFHRHVNSNGKGPVLFSLANMFKPGVFDIDNLENFTTQGVSLFMILPIEGDAHQVFNMMHNAARKIADEFGGKVLDGRRSALNKQSLQQYVEKIREFERKRMIRR